MTLNELLQRRLHHQGLGQARFASPHAVVDALVAVQAQDYGAAKWALALRLDDASDAAIEQAFAEGAILRTHVLRPTWHFVTPQDIRWLLALTAPRIHAAMATHLRNLELDPALLGRSDAALARALEGGEHLTRAELTLALKRARIDTRAGRPTYLVAHAELEGILCSGARRGKQHTYALMDLRAPTTSPRPREESLGELARRYFTHHGPATEDDFVWWSGLSRADARLGLEHAGEHLAKDSIKGNVYWAGSGGRAGDGPPPTVLLLPNYDEYLVAYTDRSFMFDVANTGRLDQRGNPIFQNTVVVKGRIVGTWRRTLKMKSVDVVIDLHRRLTRVEQRAAAEATQGYGRFLDRPVTLIYTRP